MGWILICILKGPFCLYNVSLLIVLQVSWVKQRILPPFYYLSPPNSRHVLIICSFGCLGNERPPWKNPTPFFFSGFGTMENPTLVKIILCMLWTLNLTYNINMHRVTVVFWSKSPDQYNSLIIYQSWNWFGSKSSKYKL